MKTRFAAAVAAFFSARPSSACATGAAFFAAPSVADLAAAFGFGLALGFAARGVRERLVVAPLPEVAFFTAFVALVRPFALAPSAFAPATCLADAFLARRFVPVLGSFGM